LGWEGEAGRGGFGRGGRGRGEWREREEAEVEVAVEVGEVIVGGRGGEAGVLYAGDCLRRQWGYGDGIEGAAGVHGSGEGIRGGLV
jgi:hypothetical protein